MSISAPQGSRQSGGIGSLIGNRLPGFPSTVSRSGFIGAPDMEIDGLLGGSK